jgi:hypothetical protein
MLVGLLGQKRSGKDTSADYIVEKYNFTKLAYADPLKEISKILFFFDDEQLHGNDKEVVDKFWKTKPRDLYQYMGTDIMRRDINKIMPHIGEDFWVIHMEKRLDESETGNKIISDLRYQNEIDQIHKLGGIVIKIIRPNIQSNDTHESEKNIDNLTGFDYVIINDGSKEDLYKKINELLCSNDCNLNIQI